MLVNPRVRAGCAALTALPLLLARPAAAATPWRTGPTALASHGTGRPDPS